MGRGSQPQPQVAAILIRDLANLFNLNFLPLEDPQLQVSKNYSDLTKWRSIVFKYC